MYKNYGQSSLGRSVRFGSRKRRGSSGIYFALFALLSILWLSRDFTPPEETLEIDLTEKVQSGELLK